MRSGCVPAWPNRLALALALGVGCLLVLAGCAPDRTDELFDDPTRL